MMVMHTDPNLDDDLLTPFDDDGTGDLLMISLRDLAVLITELTGRPWTFELVQQRMFTPPTVVLH